MSGSRDPDDAQPYEIAWTATALRNLDRLPEKVATAVVEFVYGSFAHNPLRVGHALQFELASRMSARRGPYRVIYRVDPARPVLTIEAVGHRSDIYRPR